MHLPRWHPFSLCPYYVILFKEYYRVRAITVIYANVMIWSNPTLKEHLGFTGVARGCGWQHLVVFINLGTFYFIGMLVAALLGFKTTLHAKVNLVSPYIVLTFRIILWYDLSFISYFIHTRCEMKHRIHKTCSIGTGIVDWVDMWFSIPDSRPLSALIFHQLEKNRAVPRFIC